MKILAIDTSSKICSVAILEDEKTIIELHNDDEKTHSVKLMPLVDKAFLETGLSLDDIGLLVCSIGPGSFTGVRIGIATIKAFADVKNIPVVGVTSLESLAYNVGAIIYNAHIKDISENKELYQGITPIDPLEDTVICSLIDAKNENVYAGLYHFANGNCECLSLFTENIHEVITQIATKISNFGHIVFVGDGSEVYADLLKASFGYGIFAVNASADTDASSVAGEHANISAIFALRGQNKQNGVSLAKAGLSKYNQGQYGDSSSLSPIYLRKSQAERALAEKIEILPMTLEDIAVIEPNFEKEFDTFWNINTLKNDFQNENATYLIAKLDGEIVGFAGFLNICKEANLMNIVTKVDKRNLGVGSKLLEALIASAKSQGCTSITLEVNSKNYPAIHLYEKFNFKRIGLRKKYYNNTDDAIIMTSPI